MLPGHGLQFNVPEGISFFGGGKVEVEDEKKPEVIIAKVPWKKRSGLQLW